MLAVSAVVALEFTAETCTGVSVTPFPSLTAGSARGDVGVDGHPWRWAGGWAASGNGKACPSISLWFAVSDPSLIPPDPQTP